MSLDFIILQHVCNFPEFSTIFADQFAQIWQNFATLANFKSSLPYLPFVSSPSTH